MESDLLETHSRSPAGLKIEFSSPVTKKRANVFWKDTAWGQWQKVRISSLLRNQGFKQSNLFSIFRR